MAEIIINASRNDKYREEHADEMRSMKEELLEESASYTEKEFRGVYISPEEKAELLEMFSHVVVQDFNDEYHMPRAERERQQEKYAKFIKLKNAYTWKIKRMDTYVEAYRLIMEIIDDVAETNGIYSKEKFKNMVLNGKIKINGLRFPKFSGKKKKKINWDYVSEFILDPTRDLDELTNPSEYSVSSLPIAELSDEEIDRYTTPITDEEEDLVERNVLLSQPGPMVANSISKKEQKRLLKRCPSLTKIMNDYGRRNERKTQSWQLDNSEVKAIRAYDEKIRAGSVKPPEFDGDFMDSRKVKAYLYALEEYEDENEFIVYKDRFITKESYNTMMFMSALEESGWNIRNLYNNKDEMKRKEKDQKAADKRIKLLQKTLTAMQDKAKYQKQGYSKEEIEKLMAKKNKEGKKNKKKKKKAKNKCENIILNAVGAEDESFEAYKKRLSKMFSD